ncbi:22264_t:CDS:1, partial [Racocetra persica]
KLDILRCTNDCGQQEEFNNTTHAIKTARLGPLKIHSFPSELHKCIIC